MLGRAYLSKGRALEVRVHRREPGEHTGMTWLGTGGRAGRVLGGEGGGSVLCGRGGLAEEAGVPVKAH